MSPSTTSSAGSSTSALVAWGQLLRLSLATTAAADIVAGAFFAAHEKTPWEILWRAVLASLCVYHGGMALNDWADRKQDALMRPERPIPSGKISSKSALTVAIVLLCAAPLIGGWTFAGIALLAALYDLKGRGPWLGPLLLAGCRGGNLWAGMQLTAAGVSLSLIATVSAYSGYVFFVSRLGRLEDAAEQRAGRMPSLYISLAACMLLVPGLVTIFLRDSNGLPALGVGAAAALFLIFRRALPVHDWTRAEVMPAMGTCLRFLLVASATIAFAGGRLDAFLVGAAILLVGYPLAWTLRQVFPPS